MQPAFPTRPEGRDQDRRSARLLAPAAAGDSGRRRARLGRRALRARALVRAHRRGTRLLGRGARAGLGVALLGFLAVLGGAPVPGVVLAGVPALLRGGALGLVTAGLSDLETRWIQFAVLGACGGLLALASPGDAGAVVLATVAGALWLLAGRRARKVARVATLAWLEAGATLGDPGRWVRRLGTRTEGRGPAPPFPRAFEGGEGVRLWSRHPVEDLGTLEELGVCCFLGGAQEASAFDFLLDPAIEMLDVFRKGRRVLRALLMHAVDEAGARVLVVNAVFGADRGVVGSAAADDAFLLGALRRLAREAGVAHLLVHAAPTNTRPRRFVSTLRRRRIGTPGSLRLRLAAAGPPVKLEIFDRGADAGAVGVLLRELVRGSDPYARSGRVEGLLVDLAPDPPPPAPGARPDLEDLPRDFDLADLEEVRARLKAHRKWWSKRRRAPPGPEAALAGALDARARLLVPLHEIERLLEKGKLALAGARLEELGARRGEELRREGLTRHARDLRARIRWAPLTRRLEAWNRAAGW